MSPPSATETVTKTTVDNTAEKRRPLYTAAATPLVSAPTLVGLSILVAFVSTLVSLALQSTLSMFPPLFSSSPESMAKPSHQTASGEFDADAFLATYTCHHAYAAQILHRDPLVILYHGFLQPGEGDYIKTVAGPKMKRSSVAQSADNYFAVSKVRTSSSAFLDKGQDAVVRCIEERASMISGVPLEDCEPLQVVHYEGGQEYRPHHDYFPREQLIDYWSKNSGQRYVTMLAYISDVVKGGGTGFPRLNITVTPKKDACVAWYNVGINDVEDARTLHGGYPVEEGTKTAINIWQRKKIPGWDSGVSPPEILI